MTIVLTTADSIPLPASDEVMKRSTKEYTRSGRDGYPPDIPNIFAKWFVRRDETNHPKPAHSRQAGWLR